MLYKIEAKWENKGKSDGWYALDVDVEEDVEESDAAMKAAVSRLIVAVEMRLGGVFNYSVGY